MELIKQYRIEWSKETPAEELFADNGPIVQFPTLCEEGDDITISDCHLAISRHLELPEGPSLL